MLYDIRLVIDYAYDAPSDHTRNLLRLLPGDLPGVQRLMSRRLKVDPTPDERREGTDFFGNATMMVAWHAPIRSMTATLDARIERLASPPVLDLSPALTELPLEIAGVLSLGPDMPHHFLGPSARVPMVPAISAFAATVVEPGMTSFQAAEAIGRAIHARMDFDSGATTVDTSPAEAFAAGRGVCQDFTHVMIAALRAMGLPAAYVSGFLRTIPPPGQPRLEGADAMHAWVRVWLGQEMGWIDFDPTNDQQAGEDYVTVAWGRDYADVAPVLGTLRSAGGHASRQAVDVVPLNPG